MTKITTKLSDNLRVAFKTADEIWVAVALLNIQGFDYIERTISKKCKINFIGGIDLPTDPAALTKLLNLKTKQTVSAYIFTDGIFHPKVFITRVGDQFTSFVGSANCTNGGLNRNIEMTIEINDLSISKQLLAWFSKTQENSIILTADFISDYLPKYKNRIKRRKEDQVEIKSI